MHIAPYLPSPTFRKKVFHIVIIFAVIFLFILGIKGSARLIKKYKLKKQIKNLPTEIQNQADVLTVGALQTKDSNKNGVPDWEERLYGLDPLANGELNLKIVKEKREQLKISNGGNSEDIPNTKTNEFARDFLRIITSLQSNGALNDESVQNIANSVTNSFISTNIVEKIKDRDLSIVRDSDIASQTYLQSMSDVESIPESELIGYELNIFTNALNTGNSQDLGPLAEVTHAYDVVISELLKVSVPQKYVTTHRALLNGMYASKDSITLMRSFDSDPVLALQGFVTYSIATNIVNKSLDTLAGIE